MAKKNENKAEIIGKKENEFLDMYFKHYPNNKIFYLTSDNMVFLENDKGMAELHQRSIGKEVVEIKIINKD